MLTRVIFLGGVVLFWLGDSFWDGPARATVFSGIVLIITGAVRWGCGKD